MAKTKDLNSEKLEYDFKQFYQKLGDFNYEIKEFIHGSLKASENQGLLDKGYYKADEILDEIYVEIYENYSLITDISEFQRLLFRAGINKLEAIRSQEVPDDISYHSLLKAELKALNEKFTTDGDGDRIMLEELEDISYLQNKGWSENIFLYEPLERQLVNKLGLEEAALLSDEKRKLLWVLYSTIPEKSKTVVELLVFGNQNLKTIANILEVPQDFVDRIIFKVKERFRLV
ncbi:hypothetical protein Q2T41_14825 [Maribacter confluentis]|uniref:Sigma-70 family RNA polymerase sigma factor n=1 Tax=Maribacter confluentis TaxID=1656093 RepID=A0ABT8RSQ3_9FLAO|nr:hypothetical protein [Maribacter confluentis]MDO1513933.1 hypothetical protein [Maribacter confluentis]